MRCTAGLIYFREIKLIQITDKKKEMYQSQLDPERKQKNDKECLGYFHKNRLIGQKDTSEDNNN